MTSEIPEEFQGGFDHKDFDSFSLLIKFLIANKDKYPKIPFFIDFILHLEERANSEPEIKPYYIPGFSDNPDPSYEYEEAYANILNQITLLIRYKKQIYDHSIQSIFEKHGIHSDLERKELLEYLDTKIYCDYIRSMQ